MKPCHRPTRPAIFIATRDSQQPCFVLNETQLNSLLTERSFHISSSSTLVVVIIRFYNESVLRLETTIQASEATVSQATLRRGDGLLT